ncbi:hypothetical protein WJX84_004123 [Apatococcus fuscideae]|uniref:Anthranilate synthase component 2 n=1 Tax=Apatococcus fuscideae TaxID=2026836 RepID=A0AAW1THY6_9CHLO
MVLRSLFSAPTCSCGAVRLPQPVASSGWLVSRKPQSRRQRKLCKKALRYQAQALATVGPVVLLDNYDSFTYNLSQYLGDLGCEHIVFKNDEKTVEEIEEMQPRGILISPGPGRPEDSGISLALVRHMAPSTPVFGVCMGHQCIGQVWGAHITRAPGGVMHGKSSMVYQCSNGQHSKPTILKGLDSPFQAARYHSLVIDAATCPPELEVTARTNDGLIMAVRHRDYPTCQGVQFHPESIITSNGKIIIQNFIDMLHEKPQQGLQRHHEHSDTVSAPA